MALLALANVANVATAQEGGPTTIDDASRPDKERACVRDTQPEEHGKCVRDDCVDSPGDCKIRCKGRSQAGLCAAESGPRHLGFALAADGIGIANLTVDGREVLVSLRMDSDSEVRLGRDNDRIVLRAGRSFLAMHDDARGFLRFEGDDAAAILVFPMGITKESMKEGVLVQYPDGGRAILTSRNLTWLDDRTLSITHFFSFHTFAEISESQTPESTAARTKIRGAVAHGNRIGAEIYVNEANCGQEVDDAARHCAEVFAYDRIRVSVKHPESTPTESDPLRVVLSGNLTAGRTFVIHVNATVLGSEPSGLQLRYFDLPDGEDGTSRKEIVFKRATGLDDILEPNDDQGQPEYWVVRDASGFQVLVSVPYWSVHLVELSGLVERVAPSVLLGALAGAAGAVVAAIALFVPRRNDG
ncbi:MAG: hypothetical protein AABX89_07525 [Candidatus Thermoplasmatota archaeon]